MKFDLQHLKIKFHCLKTKLLIFIFGIREDTVSKIWIKSLWFFAYYFDCDVPKKKNAKVVVFNLDVFFTLNLDEHNIYKDKCWQLMFIIFWFSQICTLKKFNSFVVCIGENIDLNISPLFVNVES